jgi:hypothetical protein
VERSTYIDKDVKNAIRDTNVATALRRGVKAGREISSGKYKKAVKTIAKTGKRMAINAAMGEIL